MDGIAGLGIAIAGGAGDIGCAMAAELTKHGAKVTLLDRKPAAEANPWIEKAGLHGPVRYIQADVTNRVEVDHALAQMDRLDVAIGNQAIGHGIPFLDLTQDQWSQHIETNLTGCFNVGQAAARLMVERGVQGRILFTGSWVQEVPWPEISAYSTSKAGVRMLARSMARELAVYGIRVNVIAPGIVYAGLAKHQLETEPQYAKRVKGVIPLGDLQTPEQIAQATAFLCSDGASQMTGSVLLIDGGCSLFQFDARD
ncbi:SDR family NAD(P)-dependent oxidoreductase [soil metagenome]